jgi:plastocyanin
LNGKLLAVGVVALVSAFLIACGGDDDDTGTAPEPTASEDSSGSAAQQVGIIDFAYEPSEINAAVGQELTLELTNNGTFPHTFTIDGVVDSREIAPGETMTISFTPSETGGLTFFCTVHGAAKMSGELTVS